MSRTRLYRDGKLVLEDFPPADISEHLADPGTMVWLDVCDPRDEDFAMLAEEFGLHALALEDARQPHQRPKIDRYASHCFLSLYAVGTVGADAEPGTADTGEGRVRARRAADSGSSEREIIGPIHSVEISVFVTRQALITIRPHERCGIDDVLRRWDDAPELAAHGVGFLLHGLLDHIVDGHFAAVQELDDRIETLEDMLFDDTGRGAQDVQREAFVLRKALVRLRRVALPMREMVNTLMRRDLHLVPDPLVPYYQDVYDHVLRVAEWTESLRDMVGSVMETNLTVQGNRMNLIMKKVTSWASIVAVPTAVTGFYGQNVPFPGFGSEWGFLVSIAVTVLGAVLLYRGFRKRDWI